LARAHPHAGGALGAEPEPDLLTVLQPQRDLGGRLVEAEIAGRFWVCLDLPVHARGDDRVHGLLDRSTVAARLHGLEELPAVALALGLDGRLRPLDLDVGDVRGLRGEDAPLAAFGLLALGAHADFED